MTCPNPPKKNAEKESSKRLARELWVNVGGLASWAAHQVCRFSRTCWRGDSARHYARMSHVNGTIDRRRGDFSAFEGDRVDLTPGRFKRRRSACRIRERYR